MAQSSFRQIFGLTTWLWISLSIVTVLFFLLSNVTKEIEFRSTLIFMTVFLASFLLLLVLGFFSSRVKSGVAGKNGVTFFFMQDITKEKLVYVPIGLVGVLGASFLAVSLDFQYSALLGIFLSGIIMLYAFFRTSSILIPILIHGIYNSIVVIARSGLTQSSFLAEAPISVPEVAISISGLSQLASEIIFQNVLVATSEEMFKILIIAFIIVSVKGSFNDSGITKYVAGVFAVSVWAIFHLIQAL